MDDAAKFNLTTIGLVLSILVNLALSLILADRQYNLSKLKVEAVRHGYAVYNEKNLWIWNELPQGKEHIK